jgi:hypothetical protein
MNIAVPTISNDVASKIWNEFRAGKEVELGSFALDYLGDASRFFGDLDLVEVYEAFEEIKLAYKGKNMKKFGGQIDSTIIEPLHQTLSKLCTPFQLSQPGFWRWLSHVAHNGYFWHFIDWRFGGDQQVNWGITSQANLIEVYFYRAWLRGHKMMDPSEEDPYKYAKLGSSDVWRSHILRQDFGQDREFIKALLDTVYDKSGNTVVGTTELRKFLIPAIRAWTSGASFSHLTYQESLDLIVTLRHEDA